MSLLPSRKDTGLQNHLPYAIIARINADHDPSIFSPQEIMKIVIQQLGMYISPTDISYKDPNFIIFLREPLTQVAILRNPVLNVRNSCLQMLPWSREHEWARIPWITEHSPQMVIDPLTILPVTSSRAKRKGTAKLMDNFALAIPNGYELKAPDYSYLIISELKDLYKNKLNIFSECYKISEEMNSMREYLYTIIEKLASDVCSCSCCGAKDPDVPMNHAKLISLRDMIRDLLYISNRT